MALVSEEEWPWKVDADGCHLGVMTASAKKAQVAKAQYMYDLTGQPMHDMHDIRWVQEPRCFTESRKAAMMAKAEYKLVSFTGPRVPSPPPTRSQSF